MTRWILAPIVGTALAAAAVACAGNPAPEPLVASSLLENQAVRAVMVQSLTADAAGLPADSLYVVGARTVADGLLTTRPPRFAGVGAGGTPAVTSATIEITPLFAWGVLEYRWSSAGGGQAVFGRATFVLERVGGNWRIKHVHSSSVRPGG